MDSETLKRLSEQEENLKIAKRNFYTSLIAVAVSLVSLIASIIGALLKKGVIHF